MHDLVQTVKQKVAASPVSLRQVALQADVNYWWLVKFHKNETSGMSSKGLAYVEKLKTFFEAVQ